MSKASEITVRALAPPPTHLEVRIPLPLVPKLMSELEAGYAAIHGSKPYLASLLDGIEAETDRLANVARVGETRAAS